MGNESVSGKKKEENMENRERELYKVTILGGVVNLVLLACKFAAGILAHSAAMIADAVHSLSDFFTDIIVVVFVKISSQKEDSDHPYGHGKFETLATVIIGLVLALVGLGIMRNGVTLVISVVKGQTLEAPGTLALTAAIISILAKELIYRYTIKQGKKFNSPSVIANAWHHRSDAFSSIGTALGIGGAILLGEKWRVLDPIAAIVVSLFILKVAFDLIKTGMDELLEKSLPQETEEKIIETILSVPGISSPHHLRTRRIGRSYSIDVHIRMDGNMTLHQAHTLATEVERALRQEFGEDTFINIHAEPIK